MFKRVKEVEIKDIADFERFDSSDWKELSKRITLKVVNKQAFEIEHEEDADDIIHYDSMDLTVLFVASDVTKMRNKYQYYVLKKSDIDSMNVPEEWVKIMAQYNLKNNARRRILKFSDYILSDDTMYPLLNLPDFHGMGLPLGNGPEGLIQERDNLGNENILVVTNKYNLAGTSYMFDDDMLQEVGSRLNDDFYIIPASTDKIFCIRDKYVYKNNTKDPSEAEDDLLDMLFEMNQKNSEEKVLSYRIYHYLREESKMLSIKQRS